MNCSFAQDMFGPYVDGELDANSEFQLRVHLSECETCTDAIRRLEMRREMIRRAKLSYQAPTGLERRIRQSIGATRRPTNWRMWSSIAAAILLVSALSIRLVQQTGSENRLEEEAISSHVRAMMTGHATDVVSTDQHTVKPWFNGRIDFSPPVTDLAAQGFPLVGGRVDYLDGHTAATLVYQRRRHVIDLFIWPKKAGDSSGSQPARGFNVIRWTQGGMSFVAVSDLNGTELEQFRGFLRTR
jgi:anti-sigma factor RsiW